MKGTRPKLRVLHLEDNAADAALCFETLASAGLNCDIVRVDSGTGFSSALEKSKFDLIISDFSLPGFDGKSALSLARTNHPDTPFIFVSGTIGEDTAIDSLVSGATDYVLKHKFSRLVPAVQRALREADERKNRKKAEQAIRDSEEKYRRVFEESKDGIFIRSPEGRFIDINPAGIEMLAFKDKNEVLSLEGSEALYQDPEKWNQLKRIIERQGYVRDFEATLVKKDGSLLIVIKTISALRNEKGEIIALHGIWRDVTEQRRLEAQYLRSQRLENIGKLASGIAHDLNNILAPVLMGVDLLRDRVSDSSSVEILNTIDTSGQRGAELVRQILAFGRGMKSERVPLQFLHLVKDVSKIMRETTSKGINVEFDVPKDLWTVIADGTQMHQVLINLCINARDAMPNGGTLSISARNVRLKEPLKRWGLEILPGPYIALQVRDTGTGIPAEIIDKIFEPFFTTKEPGKGTGLGMATVQTIVKGHSGLIDIASAPNRGTVVTAYIPAEVGQSETREQGPQAAILGNGELLLLVDDEAAIRDLARATLEAFGYRVITASDGAEALALLVQMKNDVCAILTDLNMPILNGRGFVQSVERIDPNARVICVSGSAPKIGELPDNKIVRALLEKPFTTEQLLRTVGSVVRDARHPPNNN
jgi:PAS domain S-box-containing protein